MEENASPHEMGKDYDGPCRETAKTMLQRRIDFLRRELLGCEQLLKVVNHFENGSPAEELIWSLLQKGTRW